MGGRLSAGLVLIIIKAHAIVKFAVKELGIEPNHIGSPEASETLLAGLNLHEWRQTVAFETVWDRPDFIPDPKVQDFDTTKSLLQGAPAQVRFYVTTPPLDSSAMVVYFLRNDSDMAKSIEHRETRDRDIEAKREQKVATVGRVGVCNDRFDLQEMYSNPAWAAVLKVDLPEKLATFSRNIALEGFYTTFKVKGMTTRTFTVSSIWNLDSQTRWPWTDTMRKAKDWGLRYVSVKAQTTTLQAILVGSARFGLFSSSEVFLMRLRHLFFITCFGSLTGNGYGLGHLDLWQGNATRL